MRTGLYETHPDRTGGGIGLLFIRHLDHLVRADVRNGHSHLMEKKHRRIDYASPIFTQEMGVRMVYARRRMKLTQDRMAKLLGISRSELSRIECGDRARPYFTVSHMQDILGRHFRYVIDGTNWEEYERWRFVGLDHHMNLAPKKRGDT